MSTKGRGLGQRRVSRRVTRAAERFAAAVAAEGRDTYIGGVPAYSTLGYFSDPLLNTFIHYPDVEIARLLFHELAHQVAYAGDDTVFNESFATVVEEEGVKHWLASTGDEAARAEFERRQRPRPSDCCMSSTA